MNRWSQFDEPDYKFICPDCGIPFNNPANFECPGCGSPDYILTDEFNENQKINARDDDFNDERLGL